MRSAPTVQARFNTPPVEKIQQVLLDLPETGESYDADHVSPTQAKTPDWRIDRSSEPYFKSTAGTLAGVAQSVMRADHVLLCTGSNGGHEAASAGNVAGTAALAHALFKAGKFVTIAAGGGVRGQIRNALKVLNPKAARFLAFASCKPGQEETQFACGLLEKVKPDVVLAIGLPGRNDQGEIRNKLGNVIDGLDAGIEEILNQANGGGIETLGIAGDFSHVGMGGIELEHSWGFEEKIEHKTVMQARQVLTAPSVDLGSQALAEVVYRTAERTAKNPAHAITTEQYRRQLGTLYRGPETVQAGRENPGLLDELNRLGEAVHSVPLLVARPRKMRGEPIKVATIDSSDGGHIATDTLIGLVKARTSFNIQWDVVGDHKNAPYGKLKPPELTEVVKAVIHYTTTLDPRVIVMACNTACSVAPAIYDGVVDTVILDLIETTSDLVLEEGGRNPILVGTRRMIKSNAYGEKLYALAIERGLPPQKVHQVAGGTKQQCDDNVDLASLINLGADRDDASDKLKQSLHFILDQMVDEMKNALPTATSLVYVCTHYPKVDEMFKKKIGEVLGDRKIAFIDPMERHGERLIEKIHGTIQARRDGVEPAPESRAGKTIGSPMTVHTSADIDKVSKAASTHFRKIPPGTAYRQFDPSRYAREVKQ
jgi:glutamate racemase